MNRLTRLFASSIFAGIAIFLVIKTWLPAQASLQREDARVTQIFTQSNTWYEVEIMTAKGSRLTCRTRRDWPLIGPSRCPLDKFEPLLGQNISILHDGKHPYEVISGNHKLIDYAAHRKEQMIGIALAGLMLLLAVLVWKRK